MKNLMKISLMKNFIFFVWCKLKENAKKFDEMIKKRLKYNRIQTKFDSTVRSAVHWYSLGNHDLFPLTFFQDSCKCSPLNVHVAYGIKTPC